MFAVSAQELNKKFGTIQALKEVSFEVERNEIFGFIGPDGAGKTTLFRILTTLILPDNGTTKMLGLDLINDFKKIRLLLGYMPGRFSLYHDLSVEENLNFFASIFGTTINENYSLIKDIYSQIEPFKKRKAGKLSGGMKQKLALSCALIHKPEILILDEPTTGVDAVSRKEFWEMLLELQKQGITIIVSTPYMDEAKLCNRVALVQHGQILNINSPEKILSEFPRKLYAVKSGNRFELLNLLRKFEKTYTAYAFGESFHFISKSDDFEENDLKSYLSNEGIDDVQICRILPDIEDSFIELMKTSAND